MAEPDPPTLTYVLVPHTGVNKTPIHMFMPFRAAEQTLDYFRERKEGKAPHPSHQIMILSPEGHQQGPKGHRGRGWGASATEETCPGQHGCEAVHVTQG